MKNIFESRQVQKAFGRSAAMLGESIAVDGQDYTGVVDEVRVTREMMQAGFDPGYRLTVVITRDQMAEAPPTGERTVTARYKGRDYLVQDPSSVDDVAVTLHLQNIH